MKYRIKEIGRYGEIWFVPQYRFKYLPIWFSWLVSYTGHDSSILWFDNYDDAVNKTINDRKERKLRRHKKIINIIEINND